jgi:ubiquitin C-terminal hydrolase
MALPSNSIIDSLFRGFYLSRLNCTVCNYTRYNLDPFSNLQISISHLENQIDVRGRHIPPNLQDGFRDLITPELLRGDESVLCERCGKNTDTMKSLNLGKNPNILTFSLKRFNSAGAKISKNIRILEELDLTPFSFDNRSPSIYDLFAYSIHLGDTQKSGHYVAKVKNYNNNNWYLMNDSLAPQLTVCASDDDNKNAYVFFYKKREGGEIARAKFQRQALVPTGERGRGGSGTDEKPWVCANCTFINPSTNKVCSVCGSGKPWTCSNCTLINPSTNKVCAACGGSSI